MRNNKLHTPEGGKDVLPQEFAFKKEVEKRIEMIFHSYGYRSLTTPMLEYLEVFEGTGSVSVKSMYKFIDRDGEILTLRSDMTPAIARLAATKYDKDALPLRLCYTENSFINRDSFQGKLHEFTQSGVELIGVNSIAADTEAITVAVKSLQASGLKALRLDLGHVDFLRGVMQEAALDPECAEAVLDFISKRDFASVWAMTEGLSLPEGIKCIFRELPMLCGDKSLIDKAKGLVKNACSLQALDSLAALLRVLEHLDVEISLDLSMSGNLEYYTGIIFRGFTFGTGYSILDGGRYDGLISKFGKDYPAVGFAIRINHLVTALTNQGVCFENELADTLLAYAEGAMEEALLIGEQLRKQGVFVENALVGGDFDSNIQHARQRGLKGLVYLLDKENIRLYDLENNEEKPVTMSELLGGGANA